MYGILISLGIALCLLGIEYFAKKDKIDASFLWKSAFFSITFGVIGARLYHVIDYRAYYSQNPFAVLEIWKGGLGIFGALILGGATFIALTYRYKQDLLYWLDLIGTFLPLGQAIGRWGNVFNKELLPFSYYDSIADFILFFLLLAVKTRTNFRKGSAVFMYLIGYGFIRYMLEGTRGGSWVESWLNVAGSISIMFVLVGLVGIVLINRKT